MDQADRYFARAYAKAALILGIGAALWMFWVGMTVATEENHDLWFGSAVPALIPGAIALICAFMSHAPKPKGD